MRITLPRAHLSIHCVVARQDTEGGGDDDDDYDYEEGDAFEDGASDD